jgi:hypothetical protein
MVNLKGFVLKDEGHLHPMVQSVSFTVPVASKAEASRARETDRILTATGILNVVPLPNGETLRFVDKDVMSRALRAVREAT